MVVKEERVGDARPLDPLSVSQPSQKQGYLCDICKEMKMDLT